MSSPLQKPPAALKCLIHFLTLSISCRIELSLYSWLNSSCSFGFRVLFCLAVSRWFGSPMYPLSAINFSPLVRDFFRWCRNIVKSPFIGPSTQTILSFGLKETTTSYLRAYAWSFADQYSQELTGGVGIITRVTSTLPVMFSIELSQQWFHGYYH